MSGMSVGVGGRRDTNFWGAEFLKEPIHTAVTSRAGKSAEENGSGGGALRMSGRLGVKHAGPRVRPLDAPLGRALRLVVLAGPVPASLVMPARRVGRGPAGCPGPVA